MNVSSRSVCFFFSSRRRHTRSLRDWSSDVCSSDLVRDPDIAHVTAGAGSADGLHHRLLVAHRLDDRVSTEAVGELLDLRYRSEERRVGKSVDLGGRRIIHKKYLSRNVSRASVKATK